MSCDSALGRSRGSCVSLQTSLALVDVFQPATVCTRTHRTKSKGSRKVLCPCLQCGPLQAPTEATSSCLFSAISAMRAILHAPGILAIRTAGIFVSDVYRLHFGSSRVPSAPQSFGLSETMWSVVRLGCAVVLVVCLCLCSGPFPSRGVFLFLAGVDVVRHVIRFSSSSPLIFLRCPRQPSV